VYRAHDSRLGRDVAIKVLPLELANDPDRLSRFDREARALAARASSSNRFCRAVSRPNACGNTLMATGRPSRTSRARYTFYEEGGCQVP
jgi:serine/threonine protein kinase